MASIVWFLRSRKRYVRKFTPITNRGAPLKACSHSVVEVTKAIDRPGKSCVSISAERSGRKNRYICFALPTNPSRHSRREVWTGPKNFFNVIAIFGNRARFFQKYWRIPVNLPQMVLCDSCYPTATMPQLAVSYWSVEDFVLNIYVQGC